MKPRYVCYSTVFDLGDINYLAEKTGISKRSLYEVRAGTSTPGPDFMEAVLVKAFPEYEWEDLFFVGEELGEKSASD